MSRGEEQGFERRAAQAASGHLVRPGVNLLRKWLAEIKPGRAATGSTRLYLILLPIVAICLAAAIYILIQNTINRTVKDAAANTAHAWASYFAENMQGLDTLLQTGQPAPEQISFINQSQKVGRVFRFKLFDAKGGLVLASDAAEKAIGGGAPVRNHNADAARVIASGRDIVYVLDNAAQPDRPSLYAEAYVPVRGPDGKILGIVEVYVDETDTMLLFRDGFYALGLSLAGLMVLAFLVPAIGFVISNNRALKAAARTAQLEVSARMEAESQTQQMAEVNGRMADLNRELANNLDKLRQAQDELIRKGRLSQLGQLTATVAHELRNPLGAVRTSAFLIERKLKGKSLGIETQLKRINNGISRCDAIISQLLDFARTKTLQNDSVAVDDWLAQLVEEQAQGLPEAVAIECHLRLGDTRAEFDPARMSRALVNLMSNASEAMVGKGDDPARFTIAAPQIIIGSRLTARGVEISVSDNGPGISSETKDRIREPLFTTKSFGTGLGLPAAEKILEQHGGGIDIDSEPGKGACFTLWWPLAAGTQEAA